MIAREPDLIVSAIFLITALSQPVTAATYARISFDRGGDPLLLRADTDTEIKAGSGTMLEVGFFNMQDKNQSSGRSTELSFGAKITERVTTSESLLFGRFTLNAAHFLHNGRWRFGAGLTYHFATTLFYDNVNETETDFDAATGFTLQVDRTFYEGLYRVGLKGTAIDYQSEGAMERDGSSIGFYAGMYF